MNPTISLAQFVGTKIHILSPLIAEEHFRTVTLHAVEHGGIWISGKEITDMLHRVTKSRMLARTPVLFVPFSQISAILQSVDGVQISDTALAE